MEISYIKKIIKLVENSDIDEIEIDEEGKKLRVARTRHNAAAQQIMLRLSFGSPEIFPRARPCRRNRNSISTRPHLRLAFMKCVLLLSAHSTGRRPRKPSHM